MTDLNTSTVTPSGAASDPVLANVRPPTAVRNWWVGPGRLAASPAGAALITFCIVTIGVLASRWPDLLDGLAGPYWVAAVGWNHVHIVVSSWIAVLLLGSALACTIAATAHAAQTHEREEQRRERAEQVLTDVTDDIVHATERITASTGEITRLVTTMPPDHFIGAMGISTATCIGTLLDTVYSLTAMAVTPTGNGAAPQSDEDGAAAGVLHAEGVRQAIRQVLRAIAKAVEIFDSGHEDFRYAANVMLFRGRTELEKDDATQREGLLRELHFFDPKSGLDSLAGVLVLRRDLSSTTAVPSSATTGRNGAGQAEVQPSHDRSLTPLALPVPTSCAVSSKGQTLYTVLPGAPMAIATLAPRLISNHHEMLRWCTANGAFSTPVMNALEQYVTQRAARVDGFLSIPILKSVRLPRAELLSDRTDADRFFNEEEITEAAYGVLNVHYSGAALLHDREWHGHLLPPLQPLLCTLGELLRMLSWVEADEPAGRIARALREGPARLAAVTPPRS